MDTEKKEDNAMIIDAEHSEGEAGTIDQSNLKGRIHISEDVIAQLATKALNSVEGVMAASPGLMANLRLGRKVANGVRISISDGDTPKISVDAYVSVKYGLRIPDACWDVQEAIKDQVEQFTGYSIKSVNVYVQGISFAEESALEQPEENASLSEEV